MFGLWGFLQRNYEMYYPTPVPKSSRGDQDPIIRVGVLGASRIAPTAMISPAKTHPGVVIATVAARDHSKASAFAKQHGIPIVHSTYQALLDDPAIDAVYIGLVNSQHYEWAMKALEAGKHVLLEKPSVSNAREAEALFRSPLLRGPNGPVLLEAFHFPFHPAWKKFMSFVDSENVVNAHAT
ncbi:MAG: hypothetical protein Q9174_007244, partial [Haloplaca sp. 1 TL-2023]